jgi:hypothetical protein
MTHIDQRENAETAFRHKPKCDEISEALKQEHARREGSGQEPVSLASVAAGPRCKARQPHSIIALAEVHRGLARNHFTAMGPFLLRPLEGVFKVRESGFGDPAHGRLDSRLLTDCNKSVGARPRPYDFFVFGLSVRFRCFPKRIPDK